MSRIMMKTSGYLESLGRYRTVLAQCWLDKIPPLETTNRKRIAAQNRCLLDRDWKKNFTAHQSLRTLSTSSNPSAQIVSTVEIREFMAVFPDVVDILTNAGGQNDLVEVKKRYSNVLQYNVPNGKKYSGLSLISFYKKLEDPDKLTQENLRLAYLMGWCLEVSLAGVLVLDDIMDRAESRRGMPSWYKKDDNSMSAVIDGIYLEQCAYKILKQHFSGLPYYVPSIELFHDVTMKTTMGQLLDMLSNKDGKPDFNLFTMEQYKAISKSKLEAGILLPVLLAMHMSGKYDRQIHMEAKMIASEIANFYQIQDDHLNCFGDRNVTGKSSCDISEGKCTWFIVVALQRATPMQRAILETKYARSEPEAVQAVRNVYEELDLLNSYRIYERESYNLIQTYIRHMSNCLLQDVFITMMEMIYRRSR